MDGIVECIYGKVVWRLQKTYILSLYTVRRPAEGPCCQHGQYYLYCNDIVSLLTKRLEVGVAWATWSDERSGEHDIDFVLKTRLQVEAALGEWSDSTRDEHVASFCRLY